MGQERLRLETFLFTSSGIASPIALVRMYASDKFAERPIVVFKARQNEFGQLWNLGLTLAIQLRRLQMPGKRTGTHNSDPFNPCSSNLKPNGGHKRKL